MQFESILSETLLGTQVKVHQIQAICRQAGKAILAVYNSDDLGVQFKDDGSPVTRADLAGHDVIMAALQQLEPHWPVLSEEAADIPFAERSTWSTYWLVDPLDGTREFVKRSDEFTINIALVHEHKPVFGIVYVPAKDVFYFGGSTINSAWRQLGNSEPVAISTRRCAPDGVLLVTVSRHISAESMPDVFSSLYAHFPGVHVVEWAGAVKGCLVADGSVDLYPRPGATCEWDTAAFQAVVEAAGGKVMDKTGKSLEYNRKASLINSDFYVVGDSTVEWPSLLPMAAPD